MKKPLRKTGGKKNWAYALPNLPEQEKVNEFF
jgi:hypothetical protein